MGTILSILSRLVLIGAFLTVFLGWLDVLPQPVISSRFALSALAQSILVFVALCAVAWLSLRSRRKGLGVLIALGGFVLIWSLLLSGGL